MRTWFVAFLSAIAGGTFPALLHADSERGPEPVQFNRDVRPILAARCWSCHGPDAAHRKADLRLDDAEAARADLSGTRAIVPGKPDESELLARITSSDADERMPPPGKGKPLTADEIGVLRRWIEEGAVYQPHWAFLSPRRPAEPPVRNSAWPRNPVDRFLLARWEADGLEPSPEADRITLMRRLAFDLTGLPPTPAEVDAFVKDADPEAYERLVDRLIASPRYGERMAISWLDLVRYADTVGYHGDQEHPISPYRDYVIQAFNENLRFDQFTLEQLAGDLLPEATLDQKIASGYNRLLQTSHEGGVQVKEYLHKYDADRVRNLSGVWMGATLGCAECHDHKYDPYTQKDFYRLAAFFADVDDLRTFKGGDTTPTKREPELIVLAPIDRAQLATLERRQKILAEQLAAGPGAGAEKGADVEKLRQESDALARQIAALKKQARRTMVTEAIAPRPIRILGRGDWMDETGEVVEPGVPGFLRQIDAAGRRATRRDLAEWLTAPDHPLTARVFMNRLWNSLFGMGLSRSLDDTGAQGEAPRHPELLDWLAVEFLDSGWNVKQMVKLLVMSNSYRQSSFATPERHARDPENRLFARQSQFRLPAEVIRDNALSLGGLLVERFGGAPAHPYQPAGYYAHLNFPKRDYVADTDENQYRRGVYVHWQRQFLHPMLKAFDAPSREECTAQRQTSNTPQSALILLNDPTFVEAARTFAARMLREGGPSEADGIAWGWRTALSRAPTAREVAALERLLAANRQIYQADPEAAKRLLGIGRAPRPEGIDAAELAAWTEVARAILNLHETIMRH